MKRIAIILSVLLAGFLLVMLWQMRTEGRDASRRIANYQRQLEVLQDERLVLRDRLAALERESADAEAEAEAFVRRAALIVDGLGRSTVYDGLYPVMESRGMTGVLALTPERMPDMDGCMSMEAFRALLDAGWTYCLCWDGLGDPGDFMTDMEELLYEAGLPRADMFWSRRELDLSRYGETLHEHGIAMAAAPDFVGTDAGDEELMLSLTTALPANGGEKFIDTAAENARGAAFIVASNYSESDLAAALDRLAALREDGGLAIGGAADVRAYCAAREEDYRLAAGERQTEIDALSAEIDELDAEIDELRRAYFPD